MAYLHEGREKLVGATHAGEHYARHLCREKVGPIGVSAASNRQLGGLMHGALKARREPCRSGGAWCIPGATHYSPHCLDKLRMGPHEPTPRTAWLRVRLAWRIELPGNLPFEHAEDEVYVYEPGPLDRRIWPVRRYNEPNGVNITHCKRNIANGHPG
eukprot:9412303-Pyramimonas_sp.AAC.1